MGFLSDFLGKSQKKDIQAGAERARTNINTGYDAARGNLSAGYERAGENYGQARNALMSGRDAAAGTAGRYLDRATGYLQPQIDAGGRARDAYETAIGLRGSDAARTAIASYAGDPFRDFNEQRTSDAVMRRYNAAGMLDSGASRLAASRANLETGTRDWQTYLDRLKGLSSEGGQYASQAAGLTANTGGQIAGYDYGAGAGTAGIYGQEAGLDYGYGAQQGGYDTTQAQLLAGNNITEANAVAASRSAGINNLLGLGGTLISGFTPGRSGASPFGNIYSGAKNALMG